jgi:hypothetical protein
VDLLAGSFLLIGATLLASTVELTLHYLRYAAVRLTLTGEPPQVGRRLDAIVDLPMGVAGAWVGIELACVHVAHQRTGANRTVIFEKDCWSDRRQFAVRREGRRGRAVVRFDIPDALPPSSATLAPGTPAAAESARGRYVWELRIDPGSPDPNFRPALGIHVLRPASSERKEARNSHPLPGHDRG